MKYKYSVLILATSIFLTVFIRMYQLVNYTDSTTGLFFSDKAAIGWYSFLILALALTACLIALSTIKRCPKKPPKLNTSLALSYLFVSFTSFLFVTQNVATYAKNATYKLPLISAVINILLCLFAFIVFLSYFIKINIPNMLYSVPMFYWLFSLVINYINISKMALIGENVWLIIASASATAYSLLLAEAYNRVRIKRLFKKMFLLGSLNSALCLGFSIPQLLYLVFTSDVNLHNDIYTLLQFLAFGVFSLVNIFAYFSNKNLPIEKFKDSKFILPY